MTRRSASTARTAGRGLRLIAVLPLLIAAMPRGTDVTPAAEAQTGQASPKPVVAAARPASAPVAASFRNVQGLSPQVLAAALDAMDCARSRGVSGRDDLLTVIDYTKPSTEKRLWVLDLKRGDVLFHELVAHGVGTGDNDATRFSNVKDSRQTSLGLFLTGGTYQGGNGYSLKLKGLDAGFNDRAEERHIVMHGAWYVSAEHARRNGRLGRSWGCPAVSLESHQRIIDTIKGGSFVFSYSGRDQSFVRHASSGGSCPVTGGAATAVAR